MRLTSTLDLPVTLFNTSLKQDITDIITKQCKQLTIQDLQYGNNMLNKDKYSNNKVSINGDAVVYYKLDNIHGPSIVCNSIITHIIYVDNIVLN